MVGWSVSRIIGNPFFLTLKMSRSLYENHWGSPALTLLNVLGVLNVLNVLNVLYVLHVLNVLNVLHVLHGRIVGLLGLVRCVLESLYEGLSFRRSVLPFVGRSVGDAFVKNGKIDDVIM